MLADANARVGSIISDAVGGEGAELETPVGEVFQSFIGRLRQYKASHADWITLLSPRRGRCQPSPLRSASVLKACCLHK